MIISQGRRYIFVHIPKTGGTSMALALEARAMKDDILIGDTPKARRRRKRLKGVRSAGRLWKHSRLTDICGLVAPDEIERFFVFTLVRNPWDRLVSYYHWLRAQDFDHPAVAIAKAHDFSAFLNHEHTRATIRGAPYGHYVRDRSGAERCDLFIRLEHLQEDMAPLERHLGFRIGPLGRVNASDRPADYRACYSEADAALVAQICGADIARFGYDFEDGPILPDADCAPAQG